MHAPRVKAHAWRVATLKWLRFFVMTDDPLSWIADRGEAWASTTVTDDVLELDVYVLLGALRREIEEHDGDLRAVVDALVGELDI